MITFEDDFFHWRKMFSEYDFHGNSFENGLYFEKEILKRYFYLIQNLIWRWLLFLEDDY